MSNTHLAHQTQFTCEGKVNMHNRKPYRTTAMKYNARLMAVCCEDGAYRSNVPVLYHSKPNGNNNH